MPSTPYRFRRCPRCYGVVAGAELKPLHYGPGHWHRSGGSLRRCPRCGHKGFTQDFPLVRGGPGEEGSSISGKPASRASGQARYNVRRF